MTNRQTPIALVCTPARVLATAGTHASINLAPHEQAKLRRLRTPTGRDAYLAAHLLVRRAAALLTGLRQGDLVLQQCCPACGGSHGRPSFVGLRDLHVSLSHSDGVVAAIAAAWPVAIDVEEWRRIRVDELLEAKVFSEQEVSVLRTLSLTERVPAAARLWVHKECLVKMGRLAMDDFGSCDLSQLLRPRKDRCLDGTERDGVIFSEWSDTALGISVAVATSDHVRFHVEV